MSYEEPLTSGLKTIEGDDREDVYKIIEEKTANKGTKEEEGVERSETEEPEDLKKAA